MKYIEQIYNQEDVKDSEYENHTYIFCSFRNVRFSRSAWKNCIFVDCDFSLASFEKANFDRCLFKGCDFVNSHLDESIFKECYAYGGSFEGARFGECKFGFITTDYCLFNHVKVDNFENIPGASRELIGEIIRQSGDSYDIMAFAGLIKTYREFCWETLIKIGTEFLSTDSTKKVFNQLIQFPKFKHLLEKSGGENGYITSSDIKQYCLS